MVRFQNLIGGRRAKLLTTAVFLVLLLTHLYLLTTANLDLITGRYSLFMDELITFDGVRRIIDPGGFGAFMQNVLDGKDHRYGRILWNVSALFSWIPYKIAGMPGQIVATRMVHATAQYAAYAILVWTFIRNFHLRYLVFITLLALPFTPYYATMPKPEPLQLLFIALFLRSASVNGIRAPLGWVWLGLAFGAKISVLPLVVLMFGLAAIDAWCGDGLRRAFRDVSLNIGMFAVGLVVAVPILLFGRFDTYFKATFLQTGHGSDNASITFATWAEQIFSNYFGGPSSAILILALVAFVLVRLAYCAWRSSSRLQMLAASDTLRLVVGGVALVLPVMLLTKRLWPFYLHVGSVLLIVGVFCELEYMAANRELRTWQRMLPITIGLIFVMLFLGTGIKRAYAEFDKLASRTKSPEYQRKVVEMRAVQNLLEELAGRFDKKVVALIDAHVFLPEPTSNYRIDPAYSKVDFSSDRFDIIIIYKDRLAERLDDTSGTIVTENLAQLRRSYAQHTTTATSKCGSEPCYRLVDSPAGAEKLVFYQREQ